VFFAKNYQYQGNSFIVKKQHLPEHGGAHTCDPKQRQEDGEFKARLGLLFRQYLFPFTELM
jgi:hypothetical protein